jgi:hypothetical protein
MNHLACSRLIELSAEAIIQDQKESEHLKTCAECGTLLRKFAEERSRALLKKTSRPGKGDNSLIKSA